MKKNHCRITDRVLSDVVGALRLPDNYINLEGDF
jgi:hypothetical protein